MIEAFGRFPAVDAIVTLESSPTMPTSVAPHRTQITAIDTDLGGFTTRRLRFGVRVIACDAASYP